MAILVVNKELAGEEDLLGGEGTVMQLRGDTDQAITRLNRAKWVPDALALTGLDTANFIRARLSNDELRYFWDAASVAIPDGVNIIAGNVTPGNWLLIPFAGGGNTLTPNVQTTAGDLAYTLQITDVGRLVSMQNASSFQSVTIPVDTTVSFPLGAEILVEQGLIGQTGLVAEAGVTIESFGAELGLQGPQAIVRLIHKALNTWLAIPVPDLVQFIACAATGTWAEDVVLAIPASGSWLGGTSVAISPNGNYVVVGVPADMSDDLVVHGSAYIYFYDGANWSLQQIIAHNGHTTNDSVAGNVGTSVGITQDTVALGDPTNNQVEVWTRSGTTWTFQQSLTGSTTVAGDLFGSSLAIDNDTIIVGAPDHSPFGSDIGAGYIFARAAGVWAEELAAITTGAPFSTYNFGRSVSVFADKAVFGEPLQNQGRLTIYSRTAGVWSIEQTINAAGGGNSLLGDTLDMSNEYIITGQSTQFKSSVFFFDGATWVEQFTVGGTATNTAVAVHPLLPQLYTGFSSQSGVVVHSRTGTVWTFDQLLNPVAPVLLYGASVAVSNCGTLVIGAPDGSGQVHVLFS